MIAFSRYGNITQSICVYIYITYFITFFKESSGFVYGAMSSFSGAACGVVLMVIQYYMPDVHQNSTVSSLYFKWILVYGCGGLTIFGTLITTMLIPMDIGKR